MYGCKFFLSKKLADSGCFVHTPVSMKKWLVTVALLCVSVLLFCSRCVQVGGIRWWHIMQPGNSERCLVESVSWQGETICLRFFRRPVDIDVGYDGFLVIFSWPDEDSLCYDVKRRCFLSCREELKAISPNTAPKPRNAADDWSFKDLLNIHDSCGVKQHWIERVERDFPLER